MSIAISLFIAALFSYTAAAVLKERHLLFCFLAALISLFGVFFTWNPSNLEPLRDMASVVQKGRLGFSFFVIVMLIGVFSKDTAIRRRLAPVRAELSVIASILIVGHFVPYLKSYLGMFDSLVTLKPSILVSLLIALLLLVLLAVLTITSFETIKKRMTKENWVLIQRFAYVFYILIFVHLCGFLIVPASAGSTDALINLIVYGVVLVLYIVLRVRRNLLDKASERIIEGA